VQYHPLATVRTNHLSGVIAACWRGFISLSLCPVVEVGRMSFSPVDPDAKLGGLPASVVVAAGGRAVYTRPLTERLALRALVEVEGVPKAASLEDYAQKPLFAPSPISLTLGVGVGGHLW